MGISQLEFLGIRYEDLSSSTQVNSGGGVASDYVTVNAGECVKIKGVYLSIPAIGGASGNHTLTLRYGDTSILLGELIGTDGSAITITKSQFYADTENPSTESIQAEILQGGMWMGDATRKPLFRYVNNSDTNQTGTRTMKVLMEVYKQVI